MLLNHLCLCVQQFSAGLSQYKLKKFGGFKVAKVLRELQRGKRLVSGSYRGLSRLSDQGGMVAVLGRG